MSDIKHGFMLIAKRRDRGKYIKTWQIRFANNNLMLELSPLC